MYAGAAIAAVRLIVGLVLLIIDFDAGARGTIMGHSITAPSMRAPVITGWVVFSLAWVALWLWMARANGRGRGWARIVSTVLFGWLTLTLANGLLPPGQPGPGAGAGAAVLYYGSGVTLAAEWLTGLAAMGLLWLAFFQPAEEEAGPPAAHRADGPVRPYFRWGLAWTASLLLAGLGYLLFRVMRGLIYEGYPWWWIVIAVIIVGPMRWLLSMVSYLLRPEWPPRRRDGQPPQGDGAAAQQEGGDDPAVPVAQQEGGDTPVSK